MNDIKREDISINIPSNSNISSSNNMSNNISSSSNNMSNISNISNNITSSTNNISNIHPEDRELKNVNMFEFKSDNNGDKNLYKKEWNIRIENYIEKIYKACTRYKKLHSIKSKNYMTKYNIFMYISIFLGPLVGMLSAININMKDDTYIPIIILCISFINGLMVSITKFRRWDEVSLKCKISSVKYASLASDTARQLSLSNIDREDSIEYLKWAIYSFNSLYLSNYIIDEETEKECDNFIIVNKKNDITSIDFKDITDVVNTITKGETGYQLRRLKNITE